MPETVRADRPKLIVLPMADLAVSRDEDAQMCTQALGAGLGVTIFDPAVRVGGLLHSLFPEAAFNPQRAAERPGMFLDTGITELLKRATELGAVRENLRVCLAGGGRILDESSYFDLGRRNHDAAVRLVGELGLTIAGEHVGGLANRVLHLNPATGEVRVKLSGQTVLKTLCKPLKTI